jgi:hypothetical protein
MSRVGTNRCFSKDTFIPHLQQAEREVPSSKLQFAGKDPGF